MKKQAILIVAVLFLLSAMAYGQEQKISVRSDKAASAAVVSKATTLYSQMNQSTASAIASQIFPDQGDCALQGADDFTVTAAEWTIDNVAVIGEAYTAPPANSFEVFFYEDNGGVPGTEIYHGFGLSYTQTGSLYEIDLITPAVLTTGTYWISVMPNMSFTAFGQWYWQPADGPQAGNEFVWRDPCPLIGSGYTDWTTRGPFTMVNYDLTFALYGTDVPMEVPLSKWVLLFSVLIMGTWIFIRRI